MFDSGFGSFFQQMPPIIYIIFCGSILLLVAFITLMVWERRRKAHQALGAAGSSQIQSEPMPAAAPPPSSGWGSAGEGDLPDIDSLVTNAQPARKAGTFRLRLTAGEDADVAEIMTVYRDVVEGGLIVQMGDKVYRHPPALADSDFKRRLNTTIRDLYSALGDTSLAPRKTTETASVEVSEAAEQPPAAPPPRPPLPPAGAVPGDLPKFKMPDSPESPKRGRRPAPEPIPEINIAASIEAFLQYKISITPEFASRSLHVKSAADGGLRIEVDGASYETVGDVADPAARAFLQETINEWQSRQ